MASIDKPSGGPKAPGWAVAAATVLGAGFSPKTPGTAGTLVAVVFYLPAFGAGRLWWAVVAAELSISLVLAALAVPHILRATGSKDPQCVVIDEVAGMLVALAFAPPSLLGLGAAFVFFRTFDILKPFPVGRLERLPGTWGVMMDDLAAGILAGLLGLLLLRFLP
jgi:phosphatidylglycerophosphatase A